MSNEDKNKSPEERFRCNEEKKKIYLCGNCKELGHWWCECPKPDRRAGLRTERAKFVSEIKEESGAGLPKERNEQEPTVNLKTGIKHLRWA